MTTLIIMPIDMAAKGSWAKRKRVFHAYEELRTALEERDISKLTRAYDAMEEVVTPQLSTDDGTPVSEALENISADDFDAFFRGILGQETIPPVTSAP